MRILGRLWQAAIDQRGWVCVVVIVALGGLLLRPALFPAAGQMLDGPDIRGAFYPWWAFAREAVWQGRLPQWDPYVFGGMPFLNNPQSGFFYPIAWISFVAPLNIVPGWYAAIHVWVAGIGMLLLIRTTTRQWLAAILAAIVYCLSGFFTGRLWFGHITLAATYSWLPWILLGSAWSARQRSRRSALVAGIPVSMAILAGHPTSLVYIGLAWLIFALAQGRNRRTLQWATYQMMLSGLVGLALAAALLVPVLAGLPYASISGARSPGDDVIPGSMPPGQLPAIFVRDWAGDPLRTGYWGAGEYQETASYVGPLALIGVALALIRPNRRVWAYVAMMVVGVLLALGSYGMLFPALLNLFPPFGAVRVPSRAIILCVFGASALLGEGIAALTAPPEPEQQRLPGKLIAALLGVAILVMALAWLFVRGEADQVATLRRGLLITAGVFSGGVMLLVVYRATESARGKALAALGLVALAVADLWGAGAHLISLQPVPPTPLWRDARTVLGESSTRVMPMIESREPYSLNSADIVRLYSARGYNPFHPTAWELVNSIDSFESAALDILSVEHIIADFPVAGDRPAGTLELVAATDETWIYRRAGALPAAWMLYEVEVIPDAAAARTRLDEADFDPAQTVILDQAPAGVVGPRGADSTVLVAEREAERWRIVVKSDAPGILVVSDTMYAGWTVRIDGERASPLTAYSVLRAVRVPAGQHEVEWVYRTEGLGLGATISVLALLVVAAAGYSLIEERRAKP